MEIVKVRSINPVYAYPKDLKAIVQKTNISNLLRDFRNFVDSHPNYFFPYRGYHKDQGRDTVYDIYPFLHYYENEHLLEAGSRSIDFKSDLPRIKEMIEIQTTELEVL